MSILSNFMKLALLCLLLALNSFVQAGESIPVSDSIFHVVKYEGYKEIIKLSDMLKEGVDIDQIDENGLSPIHLAAKFNKDPKVIQILQDHGANINQPSVYKGMKVEDRKYGGRPLFFALCYNPNVEVIELILQELRPEDRFSVNQMLTLAVRNPNIEIITYIYQLHLNELLIASAGNRNVEIPKGLIQLGAEVNYTDIDSTTSALFAAVKENNLRGVEYFLGEGANITIKCDGNKSVLISATSNGVDRNTSKIVETLVMYGCNVNEMDADGNTPLHHAVEKATSDYNKEFDSYPLNVIERLLNMGADATIENLAGLTPAEYAKLHPNNTNGEPNLSDQVIQIIEQAVKDAKQRYDDMGACG